MSSAACRTARTRLAASSSSLPLPTAWRLAWPRLAPRSNGSRRVCWKPYRGFGGNWRRGMGCGGRLPGTASSAGRRIPCPCRAATWAFACRARERTANPRCGSLPAYFRRSSSSCPYRVNAVRPDARTVFTWIGVGAWGAAGVCRACASAGRRIPCPCRAAAGRLPAGHENERRTRAVAHCRHHPAVRPHAPTASHTDDWSSSRQARLNSLGGRGRVQLILLPPRRVGVNVIANAGQILFATHDGVPKIALP